MTDTGETMGLREAVARVIEPGPSWRTVYGYNRADAILALPQLAAQQAFRQAVVDAVNGMERSCIFWCNKAWWGHIPGDARDARRMLGGRFDELRAELGLAPLPHDDEAAADDIGYHPGGDFDAAAQQARIVELEAALEPFAKVAEHYNGHDDTDLVVVDLGQCRTARAALHKDPQQ